MVAPLPLLQNSTKKLAIQGVVCSGCGNEQQPAPSKYFRFRSPCPSKLSSSAKHPLDPDWGNKQEPTHQKSFLANCESANLKRFYECRSSVSNSVVASSPTQNESIWFEARKLKILQEIGKKKMKERLKSYLRDCASLQQVTRHNE